MQVAVHGRSARYSEGTTAGTSSNSPTFDITKLRNGPAMGRGCVLGDDAFKLIGKAVHRNSAFADDQGPSRSLSWL